MGHKTNPYKANQFEPDPRQALCLALYLDPKSETFSNGLQSAIKAGYEPLTANQITTKEWFKEKTRTNRLLQKAHRNLEKFIDLDTRKTLTTLTGESVKVEEEDPRLLDIQYKATEFVEKAIAKLGSEETPKENNISKIENTLIIIANQINANPKRVTVSESSEESLQGSGRDTIHHDEGTMQDICRNIREETS